MFGNKEFFSAPYYFFLKEMENSYRLYFSIENTLVEARKKEDFVEFGKNKKNKVKGYLKNLMKSKNKKNTKQVKKDLEELVNLDGNLSKSRIPILDPRLHPKKTMDQTIAATRQTNDPLSRTRMARGYFGEIDMSKAFGYEETKDLPPKQTIKKLKKMGVENPVQRAKEMGKEPKLDKKSKRKKGGDVRLRLTEKEKIDELQKEKMIKVLEDILTKKDGGDADVNKKEVSVSNIFKKNMKSLKRQAEKEGITLSELIKLMKSE